MLRTYTYILICILSFSFIQAQQGPTRTPTKKPQPVSVKTNTSSGSTYNKYRTLGIGCGVTRSVVYLSRNVKENNDATGLNFSLVYGLSRMMRMSLEYTYYFPIDIAPTWYDIKASTYELNMHIIAHLRKSSAYFYPLFGMSYNLFSGLYTGENDYLKLNSLYKKNEKVLTQWVGFNVGTGYEYFFKPGSFFIDYKMRVGITEGYNQLNIQDVCISAGLRFNLKVRSLRSIFIYKDTRSRYMLDKADED